MDIVKAAGTAFALPSRTLYHGHDRGLDPERQEAAGKQVREWASAYELPFPEFPASYRKQIIDILDYPPAGSPKAVYDIQRSVVVPDIGWEIHHYVERDFFRVSDGNWDEPAGEVTVQIML